MTTSKVPKKVKFQISTNRSGKHRSVRVWIYDDIETLRADCRAWTKRIRVTNDEKFRNTLGVAHRSERISTEDNQSHPIAGMIRLHKEYLRTGIISHEVAHMALWIYELDCGKKLTTDDNESEEMFCHILGELNARLVNKLYEKKLL